MLRNIKKKTNAKFGSDKRAQFRFFSGAVSLHNSACRKTKFRHVSQRRSRGAQFRFYSGAVSLHSSHSQENEISPRFSTPKQTGAIPFFTRGRCRYTAPTRKKTKFRLVSQRRSRRAQFRFLLGGSVVTLTFITANKNASEKIPKHLMRFIFTYGRLNHRSFY